MAIVQQIDVVLIRRGLAFASRPVSRQADSHLILFDEVSGNDLEQVGKKLQTLSTVKSFK